MLKILLKKQIAEIFRSYFYDAKKNKARSKAAVAAYIVLFVVIMLGVLGGMLPYFAAAQIIIGLLSGRTGYGFYAAWCLVALAGFCLRALLYTLALSMSHKATFSILKEIRERILQKLPKMPLGTVVDTPSGEMKQVIVDQVESMERPLAHLLPEMTSNLLAPVCILLYLFLI